MASSPQWLAVSSPSPSSSSSSARPSRPQSSSPFYSVSLSKSFMTTPLLPLLVLLVPPMKRNCQIQRIHKLNAAGSSASCAYRCCRFFLPPPTNLFFRCQVFAGGALGLLIALAIGARYVYFSFKFYRTNKRDPASSPFGSQKPPISGQNPRLSGRVKLLLSNISHPAQPSIATFKLIASLMIFVMGVTMLKMDRGTFSAL